MIEYNKLIFELSQPTRQAYMLPPCDVQMEEAAELLPEKFLRQQAPALPEVSELDAVRHFTLLSNKNYGIDTGFYPLGSCTMKYNPKINENLASMPGFTSLHPLQPEETVQGALKIMYELQNILAEISGMARVSLQPAAGSQGELTGLMIIKAYHQQCGQGHRSKIIIPDSAHGTNPASVSMTGYQAVEIKSNAQGTVDLAELKAVLDSDTAGLMLTNPNTLGLFEQDIVEIARLVHECGGLLYYDGANMNANLGITRPGDMGFDIVHYNLHKTFSTPHGGGGPGSGPVGVVDKLVEFLPMPWVVIKDGKYVLDSSAAQSIGSVKSFYGNFGILVRAYVYLLTMGGNGLKRVSELAVLNSNYMKERLKKHYRLPFDHVCKHEFVLAGIGPNEHDITTLDIAKRLIDYGYHPPTIYFPLIVDSALMIEPTETENKETLDGFIDALIAIAHEAIEDPEKLKTAPHCTPVSRLDEVKAARDLVLKYTNS